MHVMDLAEQQRFRPTPLALMAGTPEGVLLLNLHTDQFLGLNKTAATMWELLCAGKTVEEVLHFLEQTYAAEPSRLRDDLTQFVTLMQDRHLLEPGDHPCRQVVRSVPCSSPPAYLKVFPVLPRSRLCEVMEASLTLRWVNYALQRSGFHALVYSLAALPALRMVPSEERRVQHLIRAVAVAADWQPFKALCLHQCLALCWMLRRRHIQADLVIGAYTHPFSAHAWLESGGRLLFWKAGLGYTADRRRIEAMTILFHSGQHPAGREGRKA
jgi:hypothetical protein